MKNTPNISIIIIGQNKVDCLKKCLESMSSLERIEILIINDLIRDEEDYELSNFLDQLDDPRIVFYQSDVKLTKNKARNLGMSFATGDWFFFMNDYDVITNKFKDFLLNFKLDKRIHFYRLPLLIKKGKKSKKEKMLLDKSLFYSINPASFLINSEWINKIGLKWEDSLTIGDSLRFIQSLYSHKNVNYKYINKMYSISSNELYEKEEWIKDSRGFGLFKTFDNIFYKKKNGYKKYLIILLLNSFELIGRKNIYLNDKIILFKLKVMKKQSQANFFTYFTLGRKYWWKSIIFRCKLLRVSNVEPQLLTQEI